MKGKGLGKMVGMQDKLSVGPDFDGPVRARKCTDIIFTLAIILLWITMTGVGISSVREVGEGRVQINYCCHDLRLACRQLLPLRVCGDVK